MTTQDLIAEAKKHITEIAVSEAKKRFDQGGFVILDCREPAEFKMGHIPGSINIPRGVLEFVIGKKIPDKNTKIINYCKKGSRGCLTTYTMYRMGYKNAVNMSGGFEAWKIAGYPVQ
jgi:rhodanese-related sulfurtransferase